MHCSHLTILTILFAICGGIRAEALDPFAAPKSKVEALDPFADPKSRVEVPDDPFADPNSKVEAPDDPFADPNSKVEAPYDPFADPNSKVEAPDDPFADPNSKVEAPYDPFADPNSKVEAPYDPFADPNSKVEAPDDPFAAPNSKVEAPYDPFADPNSKVEAPYDPFADPNSKVEAPDDPFADPNSKVEAPDDPFAAPNSKVEAPDDPFADPNSKVEAPYDPFADPESKVEALDDPFADSKSKVEAPVLHEAERPNVLFIAVDDLNDWIGVLGGHPQAKTPHMDRLASRGVLFSNAHCQSPVCNPSRASLMTSLYPSTSGIYFLNPDVKESPVASKSLVMPRRFEKDGYQVFAAGKLFHNAKGINETHVPNYAGQFGGFGPLPKKKISGFPGMRLWDWGVYPERDDQMPDYQIASWAEERLAETQEQPFWMGVGFYRPHVPQFAPQKWFDMYPIESVQLPKVISDDLSDISSYGVDISRLEHISPTYEWVNENEEWKALVQSYLACVSFVDAQIGRVLTALDEGAYGDNTYVVLFSDHGFHLGEKERFAKRSLWEDGTRVPLMIVGPNIPEGKVCTKPVQLLDIYPTLLELTNLEADPRHEGHSLVPLLEDVEADWPHMARSNFGPGNDTIISEQYRYIQYNDGSEEFYDHSKDPQEWRNVIDHAEYETIIEEHQAQIPRERYEILGQDSWGHKSYSSTEENANARGR